MSTTFEVKIENVKTMEAIDILNISSRKVTIPEKYMDDKKYDLFIVVCEKKIEKKD